MNIRKSILTSLVLAVIGLFLTGCCGGECPFKKLFGAKPCGTEQPAPAPVPDANIK